MQLTGRALPAIAAGGLTWAATALVTLVVAMSSYVVLAASPPPPERIRVALAVALSVMPLLAGSAVFAWCLARVRGQDHAQAITTLLVAAACCGASLLPFGQLVSTFNQCTVDVALPFWWVAPCS